MNKWLKVISIITIAASLPFVMFENRAEQARCELDVCTPNWSKGLLLPERVVAIIKSDHRVVERSQIPSNTAFVDAYLGVYVRRGIPYVTGYLLGLVAPVLLLGYTFILALRSPRLTGPLSATT